MTLFPNALKILNQLLHQRIIGYNQFLKFLASERMETGESMGLPTFDMMSTNTSSSHATAGSSCHSVPTSVLMDHLRDANQGSFSFQTPDPYPFSSANSVEAEGEMARSVDGIEDFNENEVINRDIEDPDLDRPPTPEEMPLPSDCFSDDASLEQPDSVPMDITDLDIALGELINQILGEGQDLAWLQKQVLQACHVKYNFETNQCFKSKGIFGSNNGHGVNESDNATEKKSTEILGPIPYHYTR